LGRTRLTGEVRTEYKTALAGCSGQALGESELDQDVPQGRRVLRVETVVNQPRGFNVRRTVTRRGRAVTGWFPMNKGVAYLWRHAEVGLAANRRYLDALAAASVLPLEATQQLRQLAEPLRRQGRSVRPFNPASAEDIALFRSMLRGENLLQVCAIATCEFACTASRPTRSRRAAECAGDATPATFSRAAPDRHDSAFASLATHAQRPTRVVRSGEIP
jgi:hypothetical protein